MTHDTDGNGAHHAGQDRFGRWLDIYLGGFAALMLFVLMALTFVDVIGRDVFNYPVPGGFEITELVMAAMIFAALPVVSRHEEHVVVDLLDTVLPAAAVPLRQVLVSLFGAVVLAVVAWRNWIEATSLVGYGEVTEFLHIPLAPIVYLMSVMSAIAALALLGNFWRYARRPFEPRAGADGM